MKMIWLGIAALLLGSISSVATAEEKSVSEIFEINEAAGEIVAAFAGHDPAKLYDVRNFVRDHVDLDAYLLAAAGVERFDIGKSTRDRARDFLVDVIRKSALGGQRRIAKYDFTGDFEAIGKLHCSTAYRSAAFRRDAVVEQQRSLGRAYEVAHAAIVGQMETDIQLMQRGVDPQVRDLVLEVFGLEGSRRVPRAKMERRLSELKSELDAVKAQIDGLTARMEQVEGACRATAFHFIDADNAAGTSTLYLVIVESGETASAVHLESPRLGIHSAMTRMTDDFGLDGEKWAEAVFDLARY